jgi:mono/diheme cytochrome c family protein
MVIVCISLIIFSTLQHKYTPSIFSMTMKLRTASAVVLCLLTAFSYFSSCKGKSDHATDQQTADRIERGRYLTETIGSCMHCHSQRDFSKFAGPLKQETKGMGGVAYPKFGLLYSSNITPDSATGIGTWTDDEIARAISEGIARNGDTLSPIMPYYEYNKMCREDIYSIVAYLRTLKPINNPLPPHKLKVPASIDRAFYEFVSINDNHLPDSTDKMAMGKYLSAVGACVSCHTPKTDDDHFITDSLYTGGDMMGQKFGFRVNSANITSDTASGIGQWTEAAFVDKFKSFRNESAYNYDPGKHNTLMPWTLLAQMKEEDMKALYAYIHSLKPLRHVIDKWPEVKQ